MVPWRVEKWRGGTAFGKMISVVDINKFKLLMIYLHRNMWQQSYGKPERRGGGAEREKEWMNEYESA